MINLGKWISECCDTINQNAITQTAELYESYLSWCSSRGVTPKARGSFAHGLTKLGFGAVKVSGYTGARAGIAILSTSRHSPWVRMFHAPIPGRPGTQRWYCEQHRPKYSTVSKVKLARASCHECGTNFVTEEVPEFDRLAKALFKAFTKYPLSEDAQKRLNRFEAKKARK